MKDWRKVVTTPRTSMKAAIEIIDKSGAQIALVADADGVLKGTVTDGDVRRAILKGTTLADPVETIMNPAPTTVKHNEARSTVLSIMKAKSIHQIPIVDGDGRLVGLQLLDEVIVDAERDNAVVLMAGGLGSRLRPLTDSTPKPLIKVGNKPILETIIENFVEYGLKRFYISINYKAEMIEDHFGDGSDWGVKIDYIRENGALGTAGSLSMLAGRFDKPIFVMNGDLLTRVNFANLLNFHAESGAAATMCVRNYDFQVPYGVVKVDRHRLVSIEEKPVQRFFVSAGIYVIEPKVLKEIPRDTPFDMPALFKKLLEQKQEAAVFPIREYWLDIGRLDDLERANAEFANIFEEGF
ncbi:MAG: nucleotidyltransferase family protein [Deltaproteobacteria bacterium]|nr:nucleotidyltransferase family protein [Deltaproteobacteria bacterium]